MRGQYRRIIPMGDRPLTDRAVAVAHAYSTRRLSTNPTFVQICGNGSARPLSSRLTHGREATDRPRRGPGRADARDRRADSRPCRSPDRAGHGVRATGRGRVLQLCHLEPGRPPHWLHADHVRHSPERGAGGADQGPGRRAHLPLRLRQCRRDSRPLGRSAADDPHAALPEPEGGVPGPPAHRRERRYVGVRADLGRDADVLVVARAHPACGSGVSRSAVRGIAAGTIRTWSAAGVPLPASGDAIALRRAGDGIERSVEPRFGAGWRAPKGARARGRRRLRGCIRGPCRSPR